MFVCSLLLCYIITILHVDQSFAYFLFLLFLILFLYYNLPRKRTMHQKAILQVQRGILFQTNGNSFMITVDLVKHPLNGEKFLEIMMV